MKRRGSLEPTAPYESGIWGTAEHPCPSERTLAAHLDGELDDARARLVDAHLDRCAACASDSQRIENLSHCLRAWARGRAAVEPPSRLMSRVMRVVSPEGAALRLETARSRRAVAARIAAAVLVWTGGVVAGLAGAPMPGTVGPSPALPAVAAPPVTVVAPEIGATVPPPPARLAVTLALLERIPTLGLDVLDDEAAATLAATLARPDAGAPAGARAVLEPGMSGGATAGPDLRARWLAERAALAADPRTADPSAAGVALPALPLTDAAPTATEPATLAHGGVTARAIPRVAARAGAAPYDLATAAAGDRVRLLADPEGSGGRTLVLEVPVGARPVFVPAGELVAGGVADRVVARSAWIVPSDRTYVVRLATLPLAAPRARAEAPPVAVGAVAGPAFRARLARGDDAATLRALADAQLRDAGLVGPEGTALPSLLALYARDADDVRARAAAMVADLGPDAGGFVATDPDGRFQGLERADVPEAARAPLLARLLAGYLAEARVRSVADGTRPGLRGDDVAGVLARRAPRL
ncbi:MAG: zf-HC2 domain-containing protein, partial [Planctomycetia bacterium]|nr:zf-HC2 domain-containing protein [Planctomycetia bacterium]